MRRACWKPRRCHRRRHTDHRHDRDSLYFRRRRRYYLVSWLAYTVQAVWHLSVIILWWPKRLYCPDFPARQSAVWPFRPCHVKCVFDVFQYGMEVNNARFDGNADKLPADAQKSEDHKKLLEYGIHESVADRLDEIYSSGKALFRLYFGPRLRSQLQTIKEKCTLQFFFGSFYTYLNTQYSWAQECFSLTVRVLYDSDWGIHL